MRFDRRDFLKASTAATLLASAPADLIVSAAHAAAPSDGAWDTGMVRHLLPTVSDTRLLIKVSFSTAQPSAPILHIGGTSVRGRMSDTRGEFWHFHASDLRAGLKKKLSDFSKL